MSDSKAEFEVKASTSAAQQILDLKEQVKSLQLELRDREARLQGLANTVNSIIAKSAAEVNKLHTQIQKNISQMTDHMGDSLTLQMLKEMQQFSNMSATNKKALSNQYRLNEGLPYLEIEGDHGIPPPLPGPNATDKVGSPISRNS